MTATYRLQLTPDFSFADAEALVPYLAELGVSHLYLSPITEAVPGSTHGYDAIDHGAVRSDFGGREGFESLRERAVEAGLGLVLDFVPNHMGVHAQNERWQHVLAHGPHTEPQFFDIDWEAGDGRVRMPFLGTDYGTALDDGDITLVFERGRIFAAYYEHRFALRPASYADVLEEALPPDVDASDLSAQYRVLSPGDAEGADALRSRLRELAEKTDLDAHLDNLRGPALHDVLDDQHWRLAHWRTSMADLNYRRFFQINDLAALRQEDDAVFHDTHRLIAELCAEEGVTGLRIDHIDGLTDPQRYLERLKSDLDIENVWVEKILTEGETLPAAWPTEGTSGYAFMNDAMQVLTDPAGEEALTDTYRALVPGAVSFKKEERAGRLDVMETTLAADRHLLAARLHQIATADYHTRDLDGPTLSAAIEEVAAAFERYRTYQPHDPEGTAEVLDEVIEEARQHHAFPDRDPYGFLKKGVLGDVHEDLKGAARDWALRFQQFTAPVAAKGVEDAAFYRYNRLAALCEVGGAPQRVGLPPDAFHRRCAFRAEHCPRTLLATATHDHKRGEDTRMRLIALAGRTDEWRNAVERLSALAEERGFVNAPHPADAYLFYQILAALWPDRGTDDFTNRLAAYMEKACRESGRETRWIDPDEEYEKHVESFVRGLAEDSATTEALGALPQHLATDGFRNGLSQLLLKMTTAGTPDFYQGRELLDRSLVDPDNRRPVDFDRRRRLLSDMQPLLDAPDPEPLRAWIQSQDERAKLFFTARLLQLRRAHEALFAEGAHEALSIEGPGAGQWIAFARRHEGKTLAVVAPRFPARRQRNATLSLPDALADQSLTDALTGAVVQPDGDTLALPDETSLPWTVLAEFVDSGL